MNTTKIAINGFGRIGRAFLKLSLNEPDLEVVAINDLGDIEMLSYLLQYDSVYKTSPMVCETEVISDIEKYIVITRNDINGEEKLSRIRVISEKDVNMYPWGDMGVDIVVESTGLFTNYEKANAHITAGAKRVVISAPAKGDGSISGGTVLMRVNDNKILDANITSNASCTTNASSPLISILDESIGIEKAILNTVHGYTASQALVDGPSKKDKREGRAAALNIVPTSTGAAIAVTKVFTQLEDKFDGISIRVPVPAGSIVDITFISKKNTSVEEVNQILQSAANTDKWKGVFMATEEELVSSDIVGTTYASIADLTMTRVVDGNLVKVLAWYDNEMGYTYTLLEHVAKVAAYLKLKENS